MKHVRKELRIFRGTYAEIMATETIDMAIYLAWDTREIFVGNSLGVKVPYNGSKGLSDRDIEDLITEQLTETGIAAELRTIKSLLTLNNTNYTNINAIAQQALDVVTQYDTTLGSLVNSEINSVLAQWENETLGDHYYNKGEVEGIVSAEVGTLRNSIYTKLEIDALNLGDMASNTEFQQYKTMVSPYLSVAKIGPVQSEDISGLNLQNGIYKINFTSVGNALVLVNGSNISRVTTTGKTEVYNASSDTWNPGSTLTLNGVPIVGNNITLDADNINSTATRVWNNTIPQTLVDNYVNAINPLGRNTEFGVGNYSVAFGHNTRASGEKSIAIGKDAQAFSDNTIQLGDGTNELQGSFNVFEYQLLDSDGKIPSERLKFLELIITVQPGDWITKSFVATVTGMTSNALVWVSPDASSFSDYGKFGVRATAQAINSITFNCSETPTVPLTINIAWRV